MAKSAESSGSEEYEVEYITTAKVQGKGKKKQWIYEVKWKNYGVKDNTWEPIQSFGGSEHFVETFWSKVNDSRDWHDISQFQENETLLPTGPPPKKKAKRSIAPESHKRKFAELEADNSENAKVSSETEVRSLIDEPVSRGKVRRRVQVEKKVEESTFVRPRKTHTKQTVSISRTRLSNAQPESESEEVEVEPVERSPRRGRASSSRSRAPRVGRPRASASSSKSTKRQRTNASTRVENDSSPDEILLGDKDPVPGDVSPSRPGPEATGSNRDVGTTGEMNVKVNAMQVDYPDTGAEGDVEDEVMQVEPVHNDEQLEVPSSDIGEQQIALEPEAAHKRAKSILDERNTVLPPRIEPKLPAHRARSANPRIKLLEETVKDDGPSGISTKARIARRTNNKFDVDSSPSKNNSSSAKKRGASSAKPGPGRSSNGFQLGSTSLLTVVKKGALQTLKRINPFAATEAEISLAAPEASEVPADPEVVPTGGELLQLGGLNTEDAEQLPDFEDADAEGELDIHAHIPHESQAGPKELPLPEGDRRLAQGAADEAKAEAGTDVLEARSVENIVILESVEIAPSTNPDQDTLTVAASGTIVNPPDAVIGRSGSNGDIAAWKQTTIFGPLGLGRQSPTSPTLPNATSAESPQPAFSIILTTAVHLPVVLKDIQAPSTLETQLSDVVNSSNDPAGRFYKDAHAEALINAFGTGGLCARVVKDTTMNDVQQQDFERFSARLKEGGLYLATINGRSLAFCSSANAAIGTRLGMSPDLIGLGDNILVSEVVIRDEAAYCDAVLNADDSSGW